MKSETWLMIGSLAFSAIAGWSVFAGSSTETSVGVVGIAMMLGVGAEIIKAIKS